MAKIITIKQDITGIKSGDVVYYRGLKTPFRCVSNDGRIINLQHCKTGKREQVITKSGNTDVLRIIESVSDIFRT